LNTRCALLFAGAAAWALSATAAVDAPVYSDDFNTGPLSQRTQWSFGQVSAGVPVLMSTTPLPPVPSPLRFLAEFGWNDIVHLNLPLPPDTLSVRLRFDAYLLRTWDGEGVLYAGPDTFGYGISGRPPVVDNSFSNGAGLQSYCPFSPVPGLCEQTWGSAGALKNKLGVNVEIDPAEGSTIPAKGTPMSLVYHFDTGPIPYSAAAITFDFFSKNLQLHDGPNKVIDESWGLDNVVVTAQLVPEPATVALLPAGLLLLLFAVRRRNRSQR
jgi:hypothetical protein